MMMVIDTTTIVVAATLLVLAIVALLSNAFRRRPTVSEPQTAREEWPRFSVIIPVHDNAAELERNLPLFLSQDYDDVGYEVIVVDESSTDDTDDVLTRLKNQYTNLYTTFIPDSSHYVSRRKLAMTIGVKAAHNEWLVFTSAEARPTSDQWLKTIAAHCDESADMVLGYTGYADDAKAYHRFERMLVSCYQLRKAVKGTAYAYWGRCLAMRKSLFTDNDGFLHNLRYLRGEYDFMVNEYATPDRVAVAIEPEAKMVEDAPTKKVWTNDHLFYMETRRHLERSFAYRTLNNTDTLLLHANYVAECCALGLGLWQHNWIIVGVAAVCLVATVIVRVALASKTAKLMGEDLPLWRVPFMELRVVWQRLWYCIKYRFSNKYDFIRR